MASKLTNLQVGMLGVYTTAAGFIRRGFTVAATSREAQGADLLVTDASCQRAWPVQVKATQNKKTYYCHVGKAALLPPSRSHVWIFVDFVNDHPEFLVVPSDLVEKHARRQPPRPDGWLVFDRKHAKHPGKEQQWAIFGPNTRIGLPIQPRTRQPAIAWPARGCQDRYPQRNAATSLTSATRPVTCDACPSAPTPAPEPHAIAPTCVAVA